MKILHTADWHLGKSFKQQSLLEDQQHLVDQVFTALCDTGAAVLIIAGDVFDKPSLSAQAIKIYNNFLARVYNDTETCIVVIGGNHDSGDRLGLNEGLLDASRVLIRGALAANERALVLEDEYGPIAFSALPYGEIYAAREAFKDETIKTPHDVLAAEIAAARPNVPEGARWVITAHAFVTGGQTSEVERDLAVGGVETVSTELFNGADYVALGHLHRPQSVGADHIRYSGSPMPFGFDEAGNDKSMTVVDLGPDGVRDISTIPFRPLRQVRVLRGKLTELEAAGGNMPSDDYIKAVLTDDGALIDPKARLQQFYPNIMMVEREKRPVLARSGKGRAVSKLTDPIGVATEFLKFVDNRPMSEQETKLINTALSAPTIEEV